jgi:hypothetical protein
MPRDPRVDAYIARSAGFARPILRRIRAAVHRGCPGIEETIKWGMPSFGHHGIVCGMAAFKAHCTLGFWKGRLVFGPGPKGNTAMGQFGRITSLADLPSGAVLARYVKKAAALNAAGVKARPRKHPQWKPIPMQADLRSALARNAKARATWERFPPSQRWEYLDWITGAKGVETRARRLATTVEWLAAGKVRNWRYART